MREIIDKLDFIKIKTFALQKRVSKELADKPQTGGKCLQKTFDERLLPKYTKNS